MSYFYTQSHVELQPARGIGKARRPSNVIGGITNDRDPRIDQEIQKMGLHPQKWNELMDPKKAHHNREGIKVLPQPPGYTGDNIINEPTQKKVLPRIRPGASEDELRRIWAEDERKHQAQAKMAQAKNYIDKMNDHGTSPVNDHIEPHRVGIRVVQKAPAPGASDVEPQGLKGVGRNCDGQPKV